MTRCRSTTLPCVALLVLATRPAAAQDTNHWTGHFGNRARLLSGAVVGSAGDLSAVYYNPGALAKSDRPEIAVSADAIEYVTTTLHGGIAPDRSTSSTRFTWLPSFFGGYVRFDRLGESRLAYCFLARTDLETRLEERLTIPGRAVSPDLESSALSLGLHQRITEYWFGLTWSRAVGDRFGVGLSNFVVVRDQRSAVEAILQGTGAGAASALSIVGRNFSYEHWRLIWKLGVNLPLENWSFGISLTTPGVGLAGGGDTATNRSYFLQAADSTVQHDVGSLYDDNVPARFRSPLSIAAGFSRRVGPGRVYATVEWFDAVPSMTILDTAPGQSSQGVGLSSDVTYALRSVVNWAVGAEFEMHRNWHGFTSFSTDRSAAEPRGSNSTYSAYDIDHVAAGVILKALRVDVTMGGIFAWGHDPQQRPVLPVLGPGETPSLPIGSPEATYRSYTVVFGFNFPFISSPESATP